MEISLRLGVGFWPIPRHRKPARVSEINIENKKADRKVGLFILSLFQARFAQSVNHPVYWRCVRIREYFGKLLQRKLRIDL